MYTVLIADDEYQAREGLRTELIKYPDEWKIIGEARNGKEAVEKIITEKPDILITDIKMPGFSGIEVMQKTKNTHPNLIVILLSGFAEFDYAKEAIRFGAFDYLLKPCTHQEIVASVRRAIQSSYTDRKPPNETQGQRSVVKYMLDQIHSQYNRELSLKEIADRLEMNSNYLSTLFRSEVGENFLEYLLKYRIDKAKQLLRELDLKVYEVSEKVGYKDYKYFAKVFKEETGITPLEYKKKPS